jgi:CheY-like chemotaxis protein
MARILVVDDEADLEVLIKHKFRKQIRENRYEFSFALNGKEAMEKIQEEQHRGCAFRYKYACDGWADYAF